MVKGLEPWDVVEVTFFEPTGDESGWIGDDDYARSWSTNYFLADEDGGTRWTRYGAQDQVGDWSVQIRIDDSLRIVNYSYTKFRLPRLVSVRLGVPLYGCRSDEATIFFTDSVNFSVTVDMHANLEAAANFLEQRLGVRTSETPVIYMLGSQTDFQAAAAASGKEIGWEGGFFRSFGEHQGIFIQSDKQRTELYQALTHEYVHFLLDEVAGGRDLPAWLNEGLAGFYEFEIGMAGENPDASYTRMLRSSDRAKAAAAADRLFQLPQLESQREWNRRSADQAPLQYAQSQMAVRYVTERYGESALISIVHQVSAGSSIADAVEAVLGASYSRFEADFVQWLKAWDDPGRAAARPCLQVMSEMDDEQEEILTLRSQATKEWNLNFDRVKAEKSALELRDRSKALLDRSRLLKPPEPVVDLHASATQYFRVLNSWLTNRAAFFSTNSESKLRAANELIPEMSYRRRDFIDRHNDELFVMNMYD